MSPFPFLRTARVVPADEVEDLIWQIPPSVFDALMSKAYGTGHPGAVLRALSAGRIPEGYESFFDRALPVPPLIDCGVVLGDPKTACVVAEVPEAQLETVRNDWDAHPGHSDATVLSAIVGEGAKPATAEGCLAVQAAFPDSLPQEAATLFRPGATRHPPTEGEERPVAPVGERPVPTFCVNVGDDKKWVGYVRDGLVCTAASKGEVAIAVNELWAGGVPNLHRGYRVGEVNAGGTFVVFNRYRTGLLGKGCWDGGGVFPPGYEGFVRGTHRPPLTDGSWDPGDYFPGQEPPNMVVGRELEKLDMKDLGQPSRDQ